MYRKTNYAHQNTSRWFIGILTICFFSTHLLSQDYEGLVHLPGYQVETYCSEGAEIAARAMAERCDQVISWYDSLLGFKPAVSLLVLAPSDWEEYSGFPVYGMPHYLNNGHQLVVAAEDNDFWRSFIPPTEQLPEELALLVEATYSDEANGLTMRPFFDLLAIHELGHAFHHQGGLNMQRKWMAELFADLFLHTYTAELDPERLPVLTVFPNMVLSSTQKAELPFTSLEQLETNYGLITQQYPKNYGWYQCRWHQASGAIFEEAGRSALIDLWKALKEQDAIQDDAELRAFLAEKVHPSIAKVPLMWDE